MQTKVVSALGCLLLAATCVPALADYANDRAQIENLSARYMVAVDAGDIETVMSAWAEDGLLEWGGGVEKGAAAIRKVMSDFGGAKALRNLPPDATSRQRQHHFITNHVIDVSGDQARSIVYWFVITNDTPQKDVQLYNFGHYEDELIRRNGRWLFVKRSIYNESRANRAMFYPGLGETDPRSVRTSRAEPNTTNAAATKAAQSRNGAARSTGNVDVAVK
jgi:hypothetical protein